MFFFSPPPLTTPLHTAFSSPLEGHCEGPSIPFGTFSLNEQPHIAKGLPVSSLLTSPSSSSPSHPLSPTMSNPSKSGRPHHDPNPFTRLLRDSEGSTDHGTFTSQHFRDSRPGSPRVVPVTTGLEPTDSIRIGLSARGTFLKRATATAELAENAGVKRPWLMYMSYYIPCIGWVGRYKWSYLLGDVVAGGLFPRGFYFILVS